MSTTLLREPSDVSITVARAFHCFVYFMHTLNISRMAGIQVPFIAGWVIKARYIYNSQGSRRAKPIGGISCTAISLVAL